MSENENSGTTVEPRETAADRVKAQANGALRAHLNSSRWTLLRQIAVIENSEKLLAGLREELAANLQLFADNGWEPDDIAQARRAAEQKAAEEAQKAKDAAAQAAADKHPARTARDESQLAALAAIPATR